MYRVKRTGPKIDPCGTLFFVCAVLEVNSPTETKKFLLVRYEEKQSNTVPVMPAQGFSLCMRMEWSMVSKSAVKSSNINIKHAPESAAISKSFVTLRRAVSVLCNFWNPD